MKDTVKINRDALEQLTDFVRKDIEVAHLETSDNEELTYIINVTNAFAILEARQARQNENFCTECDGTNRDTYDFTLAISKVKRCRKSKN